MCNKQHTHTHRFTLTRKKPHSIWKSETRKNLSKLPITSYPKQQQKQNTAVFTYNEQLVLLEEVSGSGTLIGINERAALFHNLDDFFLCWDGCLQGDPIHTVSALRLSACVYVTRCLSFNSVLWSRARARCDRRNFMCATLYYSVERQVKRTPCIVSTQHTHQFELKKKYIKWRLYQQKL